MADSAPAFATVTGLDHGAWVTVVDLILIFFSGIIVVARASVRFRIARLISIDDFLMFSALVRPSPRSMTPRPLFLTQSSAGISDRRERMCPAGGKPWPRATSKFPFPFRVCRL